MQVAVTVAFLGFLGWAIAGRWAEVPGVLGQLSAFGLVLAGVAAGAGGVCGFLTWRAILADFGVHLPVAAATRIFFVGQLAKYLPGKVWPILVQARLGRAYQVPGRASAAAALLAMLITLGTGLLLTAAVLPLLGDGAFASFRWILPSVPLVLLVLWPPLLNRILSRLLRLARREPMPRPLSLPGVAGAVGWSVATWLAYGVHLWLLLVDIGTGGPELLVRSVAAFAGSWSVGFLLAVAPAGVGPREVALPLLLGSAVAQPAALVVAVVSRLLLTAVDLILPAGAVLAEWARRRRSRRPAPEPVGIASTSPVLAPPTPGGVEPPTSAGSAPVPPAGTVPEPARPADAVPAPASASNAPPMPVPAVESAAEVPPSLAGAAESPGVPGTGRRRPRKPRRASGDDGTW